MKAAQTSIKLNLCQIDSLNLKKRRLKSKTLSRRVPVGDGHADFFPAEMRDEHLQECVESTLIQASCL